MAASSDEIDSFLTYLALHQILHVAAIHDVLRDWRTTGYEPDRPHHLGVDVDTIIDIGDLNHEQITAERMFQSYASAILGAVQADGIEADEEVLEILPPSTCEPKSVALSTA